MLYALSSRKELTTRKVNLLEPQKDISHFLPNLHLKSSKKTKLNQTSPSASLITHTTPTCTPNNFSLALLHTLFYKHNQLNITEDQLTNIQQFHRNPDIILTKTDKNIGWGLVPISSWFTTEYTRQLSDIQTNRQFGL